MKQGLLAVPLSTQNQVTFLLFLQAKLLFSDGKKVVSRLPHEQMGPKVKVVIVPRGLNDL